MNEPLTTPKRKIKGKDIFIIIAIFIIAISLISGIASELKIKNSDTRTSAITEETEDDYSYDYSYSTSNLRSSPYNEYGYEKYYYATHKPQLTERARNSEARKNLQGNAHGYAFWDEINP